MADSSGRRGGDWLSHGMGYVLYVFVHEKTTSSCPAKKWIQSAHLRKYGTKCQGLEASKFPSRHLPISHFDGLPTPGQQGT